MTTEHFLTLVLPAHNEEANLEPVVRAALAALPALGREFELVVVDDGSRDATPAIADRLAAEDPRVRVVHHPRNRGYGAALRAGFAAARGDLIAFMDADRQFDARDLRRLAPLADAYDIVAGYRLRRRDPRRRVLLGATFNALVRVLFGVRVRDIDCGLKLFRAELLRALDLRAPGALINTELLALARRAGATLVEVGVPHYPRPAGAPSGGSPRVILRALGEIVALWWRLRDTTTATTAGHSRRRSLRGMQRRVDVPRALGATGRTRRWSLRGGATGRHVGDLDGAGRRRRSPRGALAALLVLGGLVGQRPAGSRTRERPR